MSTDAPDRTVRTRPGGRTARVRSAVYRAVGELVDGGRGATMTIPQIAEQAGVNPTTVYRRWGTVDALLGEVAVFVLTREEHIPDRGRLHDDLLEWGDAMAIDIDKPDRRAHLRAMISARDGVVELCPCWEFRRRQVEVMVGRARDRGEGTPTVDQVLDHVVAPLYGKSVFGLAIDRAFGASLVDDVMRMAAA
ncbi:TetR/AcrR family transcriptional regulator [Gordonia sp. CPCC 205515]|uniref:TetR/AcrR family transcriptional regulator n=1 Tax=Gordonia sp. CPCC 205515 TaxID=3140791 RepID=UPI003AF38525